MITLTLKLQNGETREVQTYDYGTLAIHNGESHREEIKKICKRA